MADGRSIRFIHMCARHIGRRAEIFGDSTDGAPGSLSRLNAGAAILSA
jgi:hypothetical protein